MIDLMLNTSFYRPTHRGAAPDLYPSILAIVLMANGVAHSAHRRCKARR
jgi:hypothetical protein